MLTNTRAIRFEDINFLKLLLKKYVLLLLYIIHYYTLYTAIGWQARVSDDYPFSGWSVLRPVSQLLIIAWRFSDQKNAVDNPGKAEWRPSKQP